MVNLAEDKLRSQPELSIVVPTFNEVDNVEILASRIAEVLKGEQWEIVFVDDDSPDGTHHKVRELASKDTRIRLIHRIGRTGLSSACMEGMLSSIAPYVAIIDADMQHDETLLIKMLHEIRDGTTELIVASRKMGAGSFGEMPGFRVKISNFATKLADVILKLPLTDPMSGNFMVRREVIDEVAPELYGQGFKLLIDICANAGRKLKIQELPYEMRARNEGESKLGMRVALEYILFLVSKALGRILPYRFLKFCLIGGSGVVIHLVVLGVVHKLLNYPFLTGQITAVLTAMTSNYILNNNFTFRDNKRSGFNFWTGLVSFFVICSVGAFLGIAAGEYLHGSQVSWWLAGFATTVVAAIWNFSVSSAFTWGKATSSSN